MSSTSIVTYAKLREANPIRDAAAYPSTNPFWRLIAAPFEIVTKVACTAKLLWSRGDAMQVCKPMPFELVDRITARLGIYPECRFTMFFPTYFLGNYLVFNDPEVNKALFEHHRGSVAERGLFTRGLSAGALLDTIRQIFLDPDIIDNDVMLTCSETFTKEYRTWLHQLLKAAKVKKYFETIQDEATKSLDQWIDRCKKGEEIDIRRTGQYPSRVLTRLLFNSSEGSDEISEALNTINAFMIQSKLSLRVSEQEVKNYQNACTIFRETIERLIQGDVPLFSAVNYPLTTQQKKAMAAVLFFAGQETTGFFLSSILLHLAQNPEEQENLRSELRKDSEKGKNLLKIVMNYILAKYPPAFLVGRRGKSTQTMCLEYRFEGDSDAREPRKMIIPAGSGLSAGIKHTADRIQATSPAKLNEPEGYKTWMPFGSGVHTCPGKYLALAEVEEFVIQAILRCEITTKHMNHFEEPRVVGRVTTQFAEAYYIRLKEFQVEGTSGSA